MSDEEELADLFGTDSEDEPKVPDAPKPPKPAKQLEVGQAVGCARRW